MRRLLTGVLFGAVAAGLLMLGTERPEAHGGGLNGYGCHNDRKAGTYHCHRGPCAGKGFASEAAMLKDACAKR